MNDKERRRMLIYLTMKLDTIGPRDEAERAYKDFIVRHQREATPDELADYFYHWMELVKTGIRPEYRTKDTEIAIDEAEQEVEEGEK